MTYSYDEYNRLYSASAPAFTRSYWYDAWGNLMQIGGNSTTNYTLPTNATGAPATNRMSSVTVNGAPTSYTWDAAGNMTGEGATSFQYDAANRLKRVNNGTGGSYGYDGNSQRVKKVEGSTTLYYVRSSIIGQAVMEISGSAVYRAYVYNGGSMVAMQGSDGQFYWRHSNHLGSGYKLTNTSGVVAYRAEHDPHGNVLFETGSTTLTAHKFTSYERDSSGLDYANARMFSATRARFTKPDPGWKRAAGNAPQSLNRYSYADNDPVNMVDPAGEFPIPFLLPGTLMSLTAIATALDRTVNISAGFYYGPLAVQSILSTLALQQRPVQIPVPNHPTGIPLVVPPPPPFVRLEAAVKNAFDDLFKMFANGISKKCQENVIDKLSNYIPDFNADTFKSYLAGGVTVHNGTHSITPMSQVLTPGALRNFNMSGDQTVGANMASINAAALTVALPGTQTLNVYVDTGILYNSWFSPNGSPSTASLGALMFHEALHGYGATIPVGGENVILDNFLKGALLGGQGDPDNTHDITQYIFENCFQ
jgi:RHS repeat-associated protein